MGIPIIIIRPPTLSCPRCSTTLRRGKPSFGPTKVVCGKCGQLIETTLTPWSNLSFTRKILAAISEVIAPSRWGPSCYVLLLNFILLMVFGFLVTVCVALFAGEQGLFGPACWGLLFGGIFIYLIVTVTRLARLTRESNHYSQTGEPPKWEAGIW